MLIRQQTPNCSDFDVCLEGEGSPAFRALLPEAIMADGLTETGGAHVIPGHWAQTEMGMQGSFGVRRQFEVVVAIETGPQEMQVSMTLKNVGNELLRHVRVDICTSVNHLPGDPGWCNRRFLPDLPLDRSAQGRFWFEKVTPNRLFVLTSDGWSGMHPCPEKPDADQVPLYSFVPSARADARGCAARSPDGEAHLFQAWNVPCHHCTPCPGNACMHLHPCVAEVLAPGGTATIRGVIGMHVGDRDSLAQSLSL